MYVTYPLHQDYGTCPHCGYCPHCGRSNHTQPVYPYWKGSISGSTPVTGSGPGLVGTAGLGANLNSDLQNGAG